MRNSVGGVAAGASRTSAFEETDERFSGKRGCIVGERMESDGWHETKIRVRYKDTDQMGVVYYGNYFTFFEVARSELMRDRGFAYAAVERQGFRLAVIEADACYLGNVGYDHEITVYSRALFPGRARVRFEYEVFDDAGRRLVTGHTLHACITPSGRAGRLPVELLACLDSGEAEKTP